MEAFLGRIRGYIEKIRASRPRKIALAVFAAVLLALCISLIIQGSMHAILARTEETAREESFQHMILMQELFSYIDNEEVDVRAKLLPELKIHFSAIETYDHVLREGLHKSPVLNDEQMNGIRAAFDEFAEAYRTGDDTGLARDDLQIQIDSFTPMIKKRYDKVDPNLEGMVIIDGFKKNP